jgi:hypothetical protein
MLSAAMIAVGAGAASAGPLMTERVLPDATWVVHIDIEAIVGSNFGRLMLDGPIGGEIRAEMSKDAMEELGIDPLKDLRAVTIFGHGEMEEQAVVVISATEAIDAPLSKLPAMVDGYSEIREGNRVVRSWDDDGQKMYVYAAPGRALGERVVLFSGNIDELKRGMVRFEAAGADVAPVIERKRPQAGSFFYFSADEIPNLIEDEDEPASAFLRYAQGITIDAGEHGNELSVEARVSTAGAEESNTMLQVVQGMVALGRIAASSEPDMQPLLKLADGFRAGADGAALNLSVRVDSAALQQAIQAMEALDAQEDDDAADADEGEVEIREQLKEVRKAREGGKQPE